MQSATSSSSSHSKATGFFFLMLLASAYGASHVNSELIDPAILDTDSLPENENSLLIDTDETDDSELADEEESNLPPELKQEEKSFRTIIWKAAPLATVLYFSSTLIQRLFKSAPKESKKMPTPTLEDLGFKTLLNQWNALKELYGLNALIKNTDSDILKQLHAQINSFIDNEAKHTNKCFLLSEKTEEDLTFSDPIKIFNQAAKYLKDAHQDLTKEPTDDKMKKLSSQFKLYQKKLIELKQSLIDIHQLINKQQGESSTIDENLSFTSENTLDKFQSMLKKLHSHQAAKKTLVTPHLISLQDRFNQAKETFDKNYNDYHEKITTLRTWQERVKSYHSHDTDLVRIFSYDSKPLEKLYHDKQDPTEAKLVQIINATDLLDGKISYIKKIIDRLKNKEKAFEKAQKEKTKNKETTRKKEKSTKPKEKVAKITKAVSLPTTSATKSSSSVSVHAVASAAPPVPVPPTTTAPVRLFTTPKKHPRVERCEEVFELLSERFNHDVKNIPDEAYTDIVILLKALITDWGLHYRLRGIRGQFRDNLIYDLDIIINKEGNNSLSELWKAANEYYETSSGIKFNTHKINSNLLQEINQLRYTSYQDEKLSQFNKPFHAKRAGEIMDDIDSVTDSSFLKNSEKLYLDDYLSLLRDKHFKNADIPITDQRRKEVNKFSHPKKLFTESSTSQMSSGSTAGSTSSFLPWRRWQR